jgi:hypothetical protein
MLTYPFTQEDFQQAYEEWGANCGPSALAFVLKLPIAAVRHRIPSFEERRYTSPTMMAVALRNLGREYCEVLKQGPAVRLSDRDLSRVMFANQTALVRVQWSGPWTNPGVNPRWAYGHTHWIATWLDITSRNHSTRTRMVFDCNGGIRSYENWQREIVPVLTKYPRANGDWFPTHVWRLA